MKTLKYKFAIAAITFLSYLLNNGCSSTGQNNSPSTEPASSLDDYWYQGKAEITSYDLKQARYGEIHSGEAVLIFVTEPFSKSKQVKLDNASSAGDDAVTILKMNFTKSFNTGIYPYSMMQSVFTPVDLEQYPHALKVTTTSQEWCGHTFTQINNRAKKYDISLRSYFESEGDENLILNKVFLEDELWNRIRINPNKLPLGKTEMIPGTFFQRLKHIPFQIYEANCSLEGAVLENFEDQALLCYSLTYSDLKRSLKIYFTKDFPFEILHWEEQQMSGFGNNIHQLTTTGTKKATLMIDYWNKNSVNDSSLRKDLKLE